MTAQEWLYDGRHILRKLKEGSDFVDAQALLSLNQFREHIITKRQEAGLLLNPTLFQRFFVNNLVAQPFSDTAETTLTTQKVGTADLPPYIGDENYSVKVFSSTGHMRAARSEQELVAQMAKYSPSDYSGYIFYYIIGNRINVWPFVDEVSLQIILEDPFDGFVTSALVVDGVTESALGIKRNLTIYDQYPLDIENMFLALKLYIQEKFGISIKMLEDFITDNEDNLNIVTASGKA